MSKNIDRQNIEGAFEKKCKLKLRASEEDNTFKCPVKHCDHEGFKTERGCRKHIKSRHGWCYFFDEKPYVQDLTKKVCSGNNLGRLNKCRTHDIPSFSKDSEFAKDFCKWLTSMTGGSRPENQADQIVLRALKFLKSVSSNDLSFEEVTDGIDIDFYLGSGRDISDFIENLESKTGMGHSGQLGYISALCDLIDYRKYQGVTSQVLQNFSVAEMLLQKARKCVSKKMRIQWNSELDIESLEKRGHWATQENLQDVIPFHLENYKTMLESCQENSRSVTSKDLTFATRFIAVYLFLNVKETRPMTYQFLTVEMFQDAKQCDGFVDQKKFKTADSYSFDSFKLDSTSIKVVDQYVKHIRPLIGPKCNHLLLNRNGMQFSKLTDCMGKLVFEAIGKYIHPTRYQQIIETESSNFLCQLVSDDHKHSSHVAKVHYRKRRSRDVALKGNTCLKRLRGEAGEKTDAILKEAFNEHSSEEDNDDDLFITQNKFGERTESNQDENVLEKLLTLQPNDHQPQKKCDYTQIRSKVPFTHQEDQYWHKD